MTIDGINYTVISTADFVNDATGASSCGNGSNPPTT